MTASERTQIHHTINWLPVPERPSLWSLRIFVLLIVALGASSGLAVSFRFFCQQDSIKELEAIGAQLHFDAAAPAWLRNLIGDDGARAFDEVKWVDLRGTLFTDRHVRYLNRFPVLSGINLADTQITDAGVADLRAFGTLEYLSLAGTPITDNALDDIARFKRLNHLRLSRTQISDLGLSYIAQSGSLRKLDIATTSITDAGLSRLAKLQNLQSLIICETNITDSGLRELSTCSRLTTLGVLGTHVTRRGATDLTRELPRLAIFDTDGDPDNPPTVRELFVEEFTRMYMLR